MGIRFDRNVVRPTNGPMIFFSDPSAETALSEEIRGAIGSRLCFYAYRTPGDHMISFGSSEGYVEGIGVPGFVIAPFLPGRPFITIPYRGGKGEPMLPEPLTEFPESSTTRQEHLEEVETIIRTLRDYPHGKIIAARAIVKETSIDLGATFTKLCGKYPDAFVFCFSTPATGCWIGASPELLLRSAGSSLESMALAGTRPSGCDSPWDVKNIREQAIVTDFIINSFINSGLTPEATVPFTRKAGNVEHLCSLISTTPHKPIDASYLETLLRQLSPTPALCGMPRDVALRVIAEKENFTRGCYGGFFGPYRSPSDFVFHVNLRSALVELNRYCIFAGGGITPLSDPETEWEETEAKASTMLSAIVVNNPL